MNIPLSILSSPAASAHPKLSFTVSLLIFALPTLSVVVDHGASAPFLFLWLLGFVYLSPAWREVTLTGQERLLLWSLFAYFAAVTLSWAGAGFNENGYHYFNRAARFAIVIPLYILLRWLRPDIRYLARGFVAGAIAAGLWALAHRYTGFDADFGARASGATHPILFADVALSMGVMAAAMMEVDRSRLFRWLVVLALLAGLTASLLSASRGSWIALPALFVILMWYQMKHVSALRKLVVLLMFAASAGALYMVPETGVQKRFEDAKQDIQRYQQGDRMNNSLGERFTMWHASWIVFKERPLTGAGVGQFIPEAQRLMQQGKTSEFNLAHYHAHNIIFTTMGQQGLIGLVMLAAVMLFPLYLFAVRLKDPHRLSRASALAGVCLIVAYLHFGMSEAMFARSLTTIFYVFCIVVLYASIMNTDSNANSNYEERMSS